MLPTLLIMYTNRQLLYHPKQILFAFLLFNTAQLYNVDVLEHRICKHEDWQVWLLRVTFYEFVKSEQDTELAVLQFTKGIFYVFSWLIYDACIVVSSMLSTGFCYDLIQTIRSPFSRYEARTKLISKWVTIFSTLFAIYYIVIFLYHPFISHNLYKDETDTYNLFVTPI